MKRLKPLLGAFIYLLVHQLGPQGVYGQFQLCQITVRCLKRPLINRILIPEPGFQSKNELQIRNPEKFLV